MFDHLVHFTNTPEDVHAQFSSLGFHTIKGGVHQSWGTYNYLCYLQNLGYIEWIGFTDFEVAKQSDNVLIQQIVNDSKIGEGFSQLAFRTHDIRALEKSLHKKGFETIGPFEGSRQREDGTILSWAMLFINDKSEFRYPFFIQWGGSDDLRKNEMKQLLKHKNGVPIISYIGLKVKNKHQAVQEYVTLFDLQEPSTIIGKDEFGTYQELSLDTINLRFYEKQNALEKPFLCGISGVTQEKQLNINGGIYKCFPSE